VYEIQISNKWDINLGSWIDFLFVVAAFTDQTSCRLTLTLVAETLTMLLRLNYYVQIWLCKQFVFYILSYI